MYQSILWENDKCVDYVLTIIKPWRDHLCLIKQSIYVSTKKKIIYLYYQDFVNGLCPFVNFTANELLNIVELVK